MIQKGVSLGCWIEPWQFCNVASKSKPTKPTATFTLLACNMNPKLSLLERRFLIFHLEIYYIINFDIYIYMIIHIYVYRYVWFHSKLGFHLNFDDVLMYKVA